jgi:diaminohydroxyphosphoribosylaminopyrimidine deaminase/5-amino-6-(5-phosphoribosylamino)uracil reductase
VVGVAVRDGHLVPAAALAALHARGVRRLLLEGGPRVAGAFLAAGLVDQVAALLTPRLLGADGAPTALAGTPFTELSSAPALSDVRVRRVGADVLVEGYVASPRARRPVSAGARSSRR